MRKCEDRKISSWPIAQSNTPNVSIWWRYHVRRICYLVYSTSFYMGTDSTLYHYVADALAPCVTRTSTSKVLTIYRNNEYSISRNDRKLQIHIFCKINSARNGPRTHVLVSRSTPLPSQVTQGFVNWYISNTRHATKTQCAGEWMYMHVSRG